jgi:tripartite-type tricarboxylate transporter receptor subunit TctC
MPRSHSFASPRQRRVALGMIASAATAALLAFAPLPAAADSYPNRPVRVIVPK